MLVAYHLGTLFFIFYHFLSISRPILPVLEILGGTFDQINRVGPVGRNQTVGRLGQLVTVDLVQIVQYHQGISHSLGDEIHCIPVGFPLVHGPQGEPPKVIYIYGDIGYELRGFGYGLQGWLLITGYSL